MRAHIIGHKPEYEWIIVSRWGTHGEYVTIGWTSFPASDSVAPIQLTPYQTALAVREKRSANRTPATFRLAPSLPGQMRVAGTFVPAEGYVRLFGNGSTLGLQSEGQCLGPALRSAWHMGGKPRRMDRRVHRRQLTYCRCSAAPRYASGARARAARPAGADPQYDRHRMGRFG